MKILMAVDGSSDSLQATGAVANMTSGSSAEIDLVTIVNPPEVPIDTTAELWVPQLVEQQHEVATQALAKAKRLFEGHDATVTSTVCTGHIAHSLLEKADELKSRMIVVGAKGHSAVSRILLGSVSDDVATHAKQSVLVYRPGLFASSGQTPKVTIAVDGSESATKAVADFAELNWSTNAKVQVVCAATRIEMFGQDLVPTAIEEAAKRRTEAKRTAEKSAAILKQGGCEVQTDIPECDHIGEAILQSATEHKSDLIIVGDKGHGFLARLLLGSTSRYVLRHAEQSVLIAR